MSVTNPDRDDAEGGENEEASHELARAGRKTRETKTNMKRHRLLIKSTKMTQVSFISNNYDPGSFHLHIIIIISFMGLS